MAVGLSQASVNEAVDMVLAERRLVRSHCVSTAEDPVHKATLSDVPSLEVSSRSRDLVCWLLGSGKLVC